MTITASITPQECATAVEDTFAVLFRQITQWRDRIEELTAAQDGIVPVAAVDDLVEELVSPVLEREGALTIGAGFVAAPGFLSDAPWHLAWWLGRSNTFGLGSSEPRLRRLTATEDPAAGDFRDYTELEWWRAPIASGAPHITGPYVDYLCTDDYTLTLTMPATHRGAIIGVVGCDLYVNDIERALLPFVRGVGRSATILNASGRVVVSTDPHLATGSVVRGDHAGGLACGESSLVLVLR